MSKLLPITNELKFTKHDQRDPRLGEMINLQTSIDIIGYPDDEGIARNGGRAGAAQAPDKIREYLYKMTPALSKHNHQHINDRGNLNSQSPLEGKQQEAIALLQESYHRKNRILSFGGGHDYGYVDGAAFIQNHPENSMIINFDAHLDVRPDDKGANSGTPFFQLLSKYPKQFSFFEVGIQEQCNSRHHLEWAKNHGAHIFTYSQLRKHGWQYLKNELHPHLGKHLFISLDIDVFSSAIAPGCSQSWPTGLQVDEYLDMQNWLLHHFNVRGLGIYEVSPVLDNDHRTSKLAAVIAHHFIHQIGDT